MEMNTDQKYFLLPMLKFRVSLLQSYLKKDNICTPLWYNRVFRC